MGISSRLPVLLAFLVVLGACGRQGDEPSPAGTLEGDVLVSSAASLTDAFADLEAAFEAQHPAVDVRLNVAGSSTLREQLLEGAPADVFASADAANMNAVVAAGAVAGAPRPFARNRLQIAVPAGNPAGITGLGDFADPEPLLGLCARPVPCGDLALSALDAAGVTPSIDTFEPNVRALLTKVAAGELDAAITYATDVAASRGDTEGIELPPEVEVEAVYQIAVLANAPNSRAARAFVDFAGSAAGQALLTARGFATP